MWLSSNFFLIFKYVTDFPCHKNPLTCSLLISHIICARKFISTYLQYMFCSYFIFINNLLLFQIAKVKGRGKEIKSISRSKEFKKNPKRNNSEKKPATKRQKVIKISK